VETRGGDQGIESRDIEIPMDRRSGKSTLKTPTKNLGHPSERGRVSCDHPF
jgi:hypothetical protein